MNSANQMPQPAAGSNFRLLRNIARFNKDPESVHPDFRKRLSDNPELFAAVMNAHSNHARLRDRLAGLVEDVTKANGTNLKCLSDIESQAAAIAQLDRELAALFASLEMKTLEFGALKSARNAIMTNVNKMEKMLQTVVDETKERFGFANVAVLLFSQEKGALEVRAAAGYESQIVGVALESGKGISNWVFENDRELIVNDVSTDSRYFQAEKGINSEMAVPIRVEGKIVGVLNASSKGKGAFNDDKGDAAEVLSALAELAALGITLAQKYRELDRLAHEDELTKLGNRRVFFSELSKRSNELKAAKELGDTEAVRNASDRKRFSMLYVDLASFKEVNDELGHDVGDKVLKEVANILRHESRSFDPKAVVTRIGGDEFGIIVSGGYSEADELRSRIDARVSALVDANPRLKGMKKARVIGEDSKNIQKAVAVIDYLLEVADRSRFKKAIQTFINQMAKARDNLNEILEGKEQYVQFGVDIGIHALNCDPDRQSSEHHTNLFNEHFVTDYHNFLDQLVRKAEQDMYGEKRGRKGDGADGSNGSGKKKRAGSDGRHKGQ